MLAVERKHQPFGLLVIELHPVGIYFLKIRRIQSERPGEIALHPQFQIFHDHRLDVGDVVGEKRHRPEQGDQQCGKKLFHASAFQIGVLS